MEEYAFLATPDAHALKLSFDLISSNAKTCTFDLLTDGPRIAFVDTKTSIYVSMKLDRPKLQEYRFGSIGAVGVSFATRDLFKVLKGMRKKDAMEMQFTESAINVRIFPATNDRVIEAAVKSQLVKTSALEQLPADAYERNNGRSACVRIVSADFTKLIKDLCAGVHIITIRAYENAILEFASDTKRIVFGENASLITTTENTLLYSNEFDSANFLSILKVVAISKSITIHAAEDLPLKLTSTVGSIGTLDVYIRSIELKAS
jgi:hypothetical protein